ncbi:hypothetical protein Q8A73_016744 [Channa argus]|nr:hypothetical protein Q8A73_016744 [Channa argus]
MTITLIKQQQLFKSCAPPLETSSPAGAWETEPFSQSRSSVHASYMKRFLKLCEKMNTTIKRELALTDSGNEQVADDGADPPQIPSHSGLASVCRDSGRVLKSGVQGVTFPREH